MQESVTTESKNLSPSEAHEAKSSGNLFDITSDDSNVQVETQVEEKNSLLNIESEPWSFAEGVLGDGPRPPWLKEKYKTVSQQAAAYSELEKKLGESRGAPKDGYKFDDSLKDLDAQDPMLQKFLPKFQELNMSQDAVNKLVSEWVDYKSTFATVDFKAEMKKLGTDLEAKEMIDVNTQWMKNNFSSDILETVSSWIQTASDLKALNSMRTGQSMSRSPSASDMKQNITYDSLKNIKSEKMNNWQKYQDDQAYRDSLNERMSEAVLRQESQNKR